MSKIITHEEYCQKVKDIYGDKYSVVSDYKGSHNMIKIRHNKCGHIFDKIAIRMTSSPYNVKCPCEHGRAFNKDINSIAVVDPEFAKLFLNEEDTWKYTCGSKRKTDFICPFCGSIIRDKIISNVCYRGLSCHECGDGSSFYEKIMSEILDDNISKIDNQKFVYNKTQEWSLGYKYDFFFYINSVPYIIETHGRQHYEEPSKNSKFKMTLEEQQKIDKEKFDLAIKNGVKIENYIIINCSKDDFSFIKKNIFDSKLSTIFDLKVINVDKIFIHSMKSKMIKACDMWNDGEYSPTTIGGRIGVERSTVICYLKNGASIGYCDYTTNYNRTKVRCINDNLIFDSLRDGGYYYHIKNYFHISDVCTGKRKSCGKHPITGEPLLWEYV